MGRVDGRGASVCHPHIHSILRQSGAWRQWGLLSRSLGPHAFIENPLCARRWGLLRQLCSLPPRKVASSPSGVSLPRRGSAWMESLGEEGTPSFIHGLVGRRVERLLCASHHAESRLFMISLTVIEALCWGENWAGEGRGGGRIGRSRLAPCWRECPSPPVSRLVTGQVAEWPFLGFSTAFILKGRGRLE